MCSAYHHFIAGGIITGYRPYNTLLSTAENKLHILLILYSPVYELSLHIRAACYTPPYTHFYFSLTVNDRR